MDKKPTKKPIAKKPAAKKKAPAKPHPPTGGEKPAHIIEHADVAAEVTAKPVKIPAGKNFYTLGRRKTAVAQILLSS
ncbi:MAG: hypothetical protein AABZ57_03585, partial [Candidatus Margulisiibacteriota bacterium]